MNTASSSVNRFSRQASSTSPSVRGLCGGMTGARFVTTTEVYPDSPTASPAQCNQAQVVTIAAAIEFLLRA